MKKRKCEKKRVNKRKIKIIMGGLKIPYKGGSIHITAVDPGIPEEVTKLLGEKYDIWLQSDKFNSAVRKSGIGWSFTHIMGAMMSVFGVYSGLMIFMGEGRFTWEYLLFCILNFITFLGLCSVEIGLVANLILYLPTYLYFRPHRKFVKVPLSSFLFSIFAVGIVWMGITESFSNLKGIEKEEEIEVYIEVQPETDVAEQFCQDVFGKNYKNMTADELASVKYFKIFYESGRLKEIQYSFCDYRDFESEEEFEKTIQSWTENMGYYNKWYPIDFTMFTGLIRLDLTRCNIMSMIFSEECDITYLDAKCTPAELAELIAPKKVRVLHCESCDVEDEYIKGIEAYTQLEEFSYHNTENLFLDATDVSNLKYCENLKMLKLECGKAYKGLEALNTLTGLKSFYIDYASLDECTFLKSTSQLEELTVTCGEESDFSVFVSLPELKSLWITGVVDSGNLEELLVLSGLEELHVEVSDQEGMDILAKLDKLQILDVWVDQFEYDNMLDISCLTNLEKLQELKLKHVWKGNAVGVEKILEMPEIRSVTFSGRRPHLIFDLYIESDELVENTTIEEIQLLNCQVWDKNTGESAEVSLKEHCKKLVTFQQEETE